MKLHYLLFVFLSINTCFSQELPKLRIDLDKVYGGAVSDYLDSIEYIPLENTKSSKFGQISDLIITDSSFIIVDKDTQSVLFFSREGKFLNKISKNGSLTAATALYNTKKNKVEIIFINAVQNKFIKNSYNILGKLTENGEIKKMNDIEEEANNLESINNTIIVDENNYWVRNKVKSFDSFKDFYFFSKYKSNNKQESVVQFDSLNRYAVYRLTKELGSGELPVIHSNNFYFSTPIQHKLYKIDAINGTSKPLFQIVLPARYGIKSTLLSITDPKKMDSVVKSNWFTDRTVLGLENIIFDKDKLIFKTRTGVISGYGTDGQQITKNFFYRFKDSRLVAFEKMNSDVSNYYLPFRSKETIAYKGFSFTKEYIFTHISSLEMFATRDATKSKNPKYPPVLLEYFKTQTRKSNPVIVRMKLKE